MRRRISNLAAAAALLLCMAAGALWARSYWRRYDGYLFMPDGRCFVLALYRGGCYGWTEAALSRRWQCSYASRPADAHPALDHPQFYLAGFAFTHEAQLPKKWGFYLCRVPIWLFIVVSAGTCVFYIRKRPQVRAGFCRRCGYDLRATPQRCPECGATPEAVEAAA
jgi:hypothetical protein